MNANKEKWNRLGKGVQTDSGGWQIIYTGFALILLCFFIMLTSFASLEQSKITQFTQAFSTAVSIFSGGRSVERGRTAIDTSVSMVDKEERLARLFEQVSLFGAETGLNQVDIRRSQRGVVMTLADELLFSSGDARISVAAYPLLEKIAHLIKAVGVAVEIQGHTDDIPIQTPRYPSNWELSTARAVNVLRYLIEEQHADARRMTAVGFGEFHPLGPNDTDSQRARNRRVEIIFLGE
jgi:chemotaxis protein MotB